MYCRAGVVILPSVAEGDGHRIDIFSPTIAAAEVGFTLFYSRAQRGAFAMPPATVIQAFLTFAFAR